MESQRPPVPYSATPAHQGQHQPQPPPDATLIDYDYDYEYNEKDAYPHPHTSPAHRGSKSSYGRGRDSVISHPFSPKESSPPSPASSISSIGKRHHSIQENRRSASVLNDQNVQYPPRAHLDLEKHGYGSSHGGPSPDRVSASGRDASAIVYDQGEYHEKGPEEKAWHLLVRCFG